MVTRIGDRDTAGASGAAPLGAAYRIRREMRPPRAGGRGESGGWRGGKEPRSGGRQ